MSIDYNKIKHLVTLVEQNRLSELTVEEDNLTITIKAETPAAQTVTMHVPQVASAEVDVSQVYVEEEAFQQVVEQPSNEHLVEIKSPMVGVFYRTPSPDSPSFVEVGDRVDVGQTVGLIEAMKVFSEVPAEVAGRVVAIPAGNQKLVQHDDVLVVIDPTDTGTTE